MDLSKAETVWSRLIFVYPTSAYFSFEDQVYQVLVRLHLCGVANVLRIELCLC